MNPKICYTAAGILIHENKVLLVKHKKLGIWLNPGGHIEANELPHQAAEREFCEETGVKVAAYDRTELFSDTESQPSTEQSNLQDDFYYVPSPLLTNIHWVCKENYDRRMQAGEDYERVTPWKKGCEQHLGFVYLLKAVGEVKYVQDETETDGIEWFSLFELETIETKENIKFEIKCAFKQTYESLTQD